MGVTWEGRGGVYFVHNPILAIGPLVVTRSLRCTTISYSKLHSKTPFVQCIIPHMHPQSETSLQQLCEQRELGIKGAFLQVAQGHFKCTTVMSECHLFWGLYLSLLQGTQSTNIPTPQPE